VPATITAPLPVIWPDAGPDGSIATGHVPPDVLDDSPQGMSATAGLGAADVIAQ
jgi:hypothetical protein